MGCYETPLYLFVETARPHRGIMIMVMIMLKLHITTSLHVTSPHLTHLFKLYIILFPPSVLQIGKQAPYYVGASQTLPRGMYTDRNKVAMGKFGQQMLLCLVEQKINYVWFLFSYEHCTY